MKHLFTFVVAGIADGSIYALAAVGLVLTFRISGVFNFAYGSVAAASAYVFYQLRERQHLPWPVAAVLTVILMGIGGGLLLERIGYWLSEASTVLRVVATIGILASLSAFLTGFYGAATLEMKGFLPSKGVHIAGINVTGSEIITFLIALVGTAALYLFFKRARMGIAMQAVVDDAPLVSMQGLSPIAIRRVAWVIGSSFVSISGVLLAPKIGVDVNDLTLLVLTAFGAAALGAFSNLPLAFLGGIIIGIGEDVMSYKMAGVQNFSLQQLYVNLPFIVLVAVLVLVPRRHLVERGVQRVRRMKASAPLPKELTASGVVGGLALAVIIPFVVGTRLGQFTTGLAFMVIFASLALLIWTSGQVSLAQMAFAALGAATFSHLLTDGFPWVIALLATGLVTLPVGAIVAIPAIRVSGIYLAILTFGFGLLIQRLFFSTFLMFGITDSAPVTRPKLFGSTINTASDKGYYFVSLVVAILCVGLIVAVRQSRLGRLLRAYGDSPTALLAHGVNTTATGVFVFCISAFVAGIGGALASGVIGRASGPSFDFSISLTMIAVLASSLVFTLGRRMTIIGSAIASFLYVVLKVYVTNSFFIRYEGVAFGILAVAVACGPGISAPRGLKRGRSGERAGSPSPALMELPLFAHGAAR